MNNAVRSAQVPWDVSITSLEASDEYDELTGSVRYCPTRLLAAFALLMSGHGRCVSADMMLGDREYAMWQLARAHTLQDRELREVASKLFAYFDDERAQVPVGMRA
jgi:hypothetical protein